GRLCGIVIFRVMGAEFPAGYVYVSLPFRWNTVFMPLCAGKSTVAFGHVVSVFFPGFHVYAESAFKFIRPWLICAVLAFKRKHWRKRFFTGMHFACVAFCRICCIFVL